MPTYDVCALGCVCWDFVTTVDHYPEADAKVRLETLLQMGGGLSGTAMAAVASLGGKAAIFGRVGTDSFGEQILAGFAREGVATHGIEVLPGETSQFAFCVAEAGSGHRTIFYMPGSYCRMGPGEVDLAALSDCRCLLVDHHHLGAATEAARYARARGLPVVADIERDQPGAADFLAAVSHPIMPAGFVRGYTATDDLAAAAARMLALGPEAVIVTQGRQGATAYTRDGALHQPAFAVEPVTDTTGAGDVFHGAFAYGLALGYDLERNLAFSAAAAALSCRGLGGRGALPTMAEVEGLLG
jgi:ribokinase